MKAHHITKHDEFGRVVIPKGIRESLGLMPGSLLRIEQRGPELVLSPVAAEPKLVRKGGILVAQGEPLQELRGLEKKLRQQRVRRLTGAAT